MRKRNVLNVCEMCKKPFYAHRSDSLTCSPKCRKAKQRQKSAARRLEVLIEKVAAKVVWRRVYAGCLTAEIDGNNYVVEKMYQDDGKRETYYWTWYKDNGLNSVGEDNYRTCRAAQRACVDWVSASV